MAQKDSVCAKFAQTAEEYSVVQIEGNMEITSTGKR